MRLNLGAGNTKLDGFISVDLYDTEADVRADITELPFDSESVDEIVCYQVIEHVPYNKSRQMFDEMYRVLKPGGTAVLAVAAVVDHRMALAESVCMGLEIMVLPELHRQEA